MHGMTRYHKQDNFPDLMQKVIIIKILVGFVVELDKLILKLVRKGKE